MGTRSGIKCKMGCMLATSCARQWQPRFTATSWAALARRLRSMGPILADTSSPRTTNKAAVIAALFVTRYGKRQVAVVIRQRNGMSCQLRSNLRPRRYLISGHTLPPGPRLWPMLPKAEMTCTATSSSSGSIISFPIRTAPLAPTARRASFGASVAPRSGITITSPAFIWRYAQESAFRERLRRDANGTQVSRIMGLALAARPSVDFCGYWQRTI